MIATIDPIERRQALKPLVQYFELDSVQAVAPGEMVHDYYGAPPFLVQHYLERLGAIPAGVTASGDKLFARRACFIQVSSAPCKRIGSLEIGGARVEFTGAADDIQDLLANLEWMTQRW